MTVVKEKSAKIPVKVFGAKVSHAKVGGKKGASAPEDLALARKDLISRIQNLRFTTRDVATAYLANLERDILEISDLLNAEESKRLLTSQKLKAMTKTLERLSLKPEKGRRKDLKKIEKTIEKLRGILKSESSKS
jgi:hypothetical protein